MAQQLPHHHILLLFFLLLVVVSYVPPVIAAEGGETREGHGFTIASPSPPNPPGFMDTGPISTGPETSTQTPSNAGYTYESSAQGGGVGSSVQREAETTPKKSSSPKTPQDSIRSDEVQFGAAPPEGPPRRESTTSKATKHPEVEVNRGGGGGGEPHIRIKSSFEVPPEDWNAPRPKREASRAAEDAKKDTTTTQNEPPRTAKLSKVETKPDTKAGSTKGSAKGSATGMPSVLSIADEVDHTYAGHDSSDQHKLYKDLFRDYNKHIRPVEHHDDIITVHFEVALFNVLALDTKEGIMITNTEVILIWRDPYLSWDPDYYNQTKYLRVLYSDVWHPDVILYNSADTSYEDSMINTNIIIEYDGTTTLLTHAIFTSVCDIDIQWFPFDQQTCDMIFSSWTADVNQMLLELGPSDITRYHPNQEFFLENFYAEQLEDFDPCCKEPFSIISYHIQLQRRVKFALFFFIVPGVLINICALLVFTLPAESGEKVGLGINAMLAMMVFLMAMIENLPPSQTLPLAGVYYGVCLIVLTFNIAFSVYVLNLSQQGDRGHPVPGWWRMIGVYTAKGLFIKIPDYIVKGWDLGKREMKQKELDAVSEMKGFKHVNMDIFNVQPALAQEGTYMFKDPFQRRSIEALEGILRLLAQEEDESRARDDKVQLVDEWKFLSRVMDRLLFIIFGIVTFLFNIIILMQSPYGEKFEYCPLGKDMCDDDYVLESIDDLTVKGGLSGGTAGGGH